MSFFHSWSMIIACLVLLLSGCVKAIEKVSTPLPPSPPPHEQRVKIELDGPYDNEIPEGYQVILKDIEAADWRIPQIFVAVADHFGVEGDEAKAIHFLDRATEVFVARQEASGEAMVFCRKMLLLMRSGRENEAIALLRAGEQKWETSQLQIFLSYIHGRRALFYGDFGRAREHLINSLKGNTNFLTDVYQLQLRRDSELAIGMATVLSDHLPLLLTTYRLQERPISETSLNSKSSNHIREALALNQELRQSTVGPLIPAIDFQKVEADAYLFLGFEEGMGGNESESIRLLSDAAELSKTANFRESQLWSLLLLGEFALNREEHAYGHGAVEMALKLADALQAASYRIWARLLLARYFKGEGRVREAIEVLREADEILTMQRSGPQVEMFGELCRFQRRLVYEYLVELMAAEGMAGEALTAAEKAKSLMRVDLLDSQYVGVTPVERDLLQREVELGETIRRLQLKILNVSSDNLTRELLEQLRAAYGAYRELLDRFQEDTDKLLFLVSARGIEASALQQLLDRDTTLFAYFTTDRSLFVWAIHAGIVHIERINVTRDELRKLALSYIEAIQFRERRKTASLSRKAYDLLLKPVIPYVTGDRVGFIPDDVLTDFPFAAMNYRGKFLIEGFSIFYLREARHLASFLDNMSGYDMLDSRTRLVVSMLWPMDDPMGVHLQELFYRQLERKESIADSLRTAQLHLLREGAPPHVWAAFILTGNL
jgi:tetratricopeptide (TPR) repeat protein